MVPPPLIVYILCIYYAVLHGYTSIYILAPKAADKMNHHLSLRDSPHLLPAAVQAPLRITGFFQPHACFFTFLLYIL
jgi:hypothetical protein